MTELATAVDGSLVLDSAQHAFTPAQVAALTHIGVEGASDGDLQVFHHVCQRTGLDPFARQIYMIGRRSRVKEGGQWVDGPVKQTIQTGIDGFRLIGRRAADAAKHKLSVGAPEWAHQETGWQQIWVAAWGTPVAARVTITRDGEPFTAIALFDEYKQTKSGGQLTSMWTQRPAGQLAKCAEALAWRMAFPQDLSGIYSDEEMQQADSAPTVAHVRESGGLDAALAADADPAPAEPDPDGAVDADVVEDQAESVTAAQLRKIGAAMTKLGITARDEALGYVHQAIGRQVASRNELTKDEASNLIERLEGDIALVANEAQS